MLLAGTEFVSCQRRRDGLSTAKPIGWGSSHKSLERFVSRASIKLAGFILLVRVRVSAGVCIFAQIGSGGPQKRLVRQWITSILLGDLILALAGLHD